MPCKVVNLGNGVTAIVKMAAKPRKRCSVCGMLGVGKLCDFPLTGAKAGKTCDRPLCANCAFHQAPDTDLCPVHARLDWQGQQIELFDPAFPKPVKSIP
jgi:hypothetical protein